MATTPFEIPKLPEGLTLVADFYPRGSETADATDVVLTEETNRKGTYSGTLSASSSGLITVKVRLGTIVIAEITAAILDTTDVFILEDGDRIIQAFSGSGAGLLSSLYTSKAEMKSIFGNLGVVLHADDDDDGVNNASEDAFIDDVVTEATDEANMYLLHHYLVVDLANSSWVRRRCSKTALHHLSRRRGNGPMFTDEYETVIDEFKRSMQGKLWIPNLKTHSNFHPSISNTMIDYRYRRRVIRVSPHTSTGGSYPDQQIERLPVDHPWS